uniref:DDE-1 domain-containing protein n=1 Tax=Branchiostoma floridae TaxID=7739 RepID=C3XUF2_BRAFL|eukprot:XP_002612517.1 hypothetical protein BRAFLDRAFT_75361 [Branchiostoma floridae]
MTITEVERNTTKEQTSGQSVYNTWLEKRRKKMTASKFGPAITCRVEPSKKLSSILYSNFFTAATAFGTSTRELEVAVDKYVLTKRLTDNLQGDVALNHVELKFFPPNTTSRLQPRDQGIIQTVKLKYHKRQLRRILQELEDDKEATGTQAAKRLTVLQAIQFVGAAWRETSPETIQKCFRKAGFYETPADIETESASTEPSGHHDAGMEQLAQELFGCNVQDLAEIDQDLATCETEARD